MDKLIQKIEKENSTLSQKMKSIYNTYFPHKAYGTFCSLVTKGVIIATILAVVFPSEVQYKLTLDFNPLSVEEVIIASMPQAASALPAPVPATFIADEDNLETEKVIFEEVKPNDLKGIAAQKQYIKDYQAIARLEMERYGIPASITLAQGLLESQAGKSKLAKRIKNHFGMKCFNRKCVRSHCANFEDDHHKDFFRRYSNAQESYRAHSIFLVTGKKREKASYGWMVDEYPVGSKDYSQRWAHGLKECGYATDKRYAFKLIKLMDRYNLTDYDTNS